MLRDKRGSPMCEVTAQLHDLLSTRALVPLLRWQQVARPSRRGFRSAYRDARRFHSTTVGWSDDRKRDWMLARLRVQVRRAYAEPGYSRDQFDRLGFEPQTEFSFEDFAQLPPLEREDIHRA